MSKLIIEVLQNLPQDVANEIRKLNPGVRGQNPQLDGNNIVAGRLTYKDVLGILKKRGISFNREALVIQPRSSEKPTQRLQLDRVEHINPGVSRDIKPRETLFTQEDTSISLVQELDEDRETTFLRNMCLLPSGTADVLYNTLAFVADAVNEQKSEDHPGIFPWDMIEWDAKRNSEHGRIELLPSLKPIAQVTPDLAKDMWTYIVISKRVQDGFLYEGAQKQLVDSVVKMQSQPELVTQLLALGEIPNGLGNPAVSE